MIDIDFECDFCPSPRRQGIEKRINISLSCRAAAFNIRFDRPGIAYLTTANHQFGMQAVVFYQVAGIGPGGQNSQRIQAALMI